MTLTATRLTQHQSLLSQTTPATVPNLPTTNRLFRFHTKRPSLPIILFNRAGFGQRPLDLEQFQQLGATDTQRLINYVEQQLNPNSISDTDFETYLAAANFSTIHKSRAELSSAHLQKTIEYPQQTLPLRELERLNFLRAIYSRSQLVELLADFWHDYFNIYAWQSPQIAATIIDYDANVIRANLLGNYQQFVDAVVSSSEWQLSNEIANLSPWQEMEDHEETARFVCTKLCCRFISDHPTSQIVQSATTIFLNQQSAPDQLKQVVRHILLSTEFQNTWGEKVKRPFETIVSALRATNTNLIIQYDHAISDSFMWRYSQIGQAPFASPEPGGYPDVKSHWQNNTHLRMRWRMINWLMELQDENGRFHLNTQPQSGSPQKQTANTLVDYWINHIFGYKIAPEDRQILVNYLANDQRLDAPINLLTQSGQQRLRETIALMLNSPQFQLR
ncbi:MAG: DUF1800 family protein [Chloroflexi bacterium]|nr:MAG: DUF1800 family protein [Chloroflexota bacterium]